MSDIFTGVRVVDWTTGQVGPYATAMLADLGAEVIHVERRMSGDGTRGSTHWFGISIRLPHNRGSTFWEEHNRNKQSLTVDVTKAEGREIVYRLVKKSDVFVTNFRERAAKKDGLDYETLRQLNPRLIYAISSAFGPKGPDANQGSLDLVAHARSGAMMASGEVGTPPAMLPVGLGDRLTSFLLAYGIVAALYAREKLGIGQRVDTSQLGSMFVLQGNSATGYALLKREFPRFDRTKARNPLYSYYQCKDGKWIALAGARSSQYWSGVCEAIGMPELQADPRFVDEDRRAENCEELVRILDTAFKNKAREELLIKLVARDILCAPCNTMPELFDDPQILANEYLIDYEHPVLGPIKFVGFPVQFSETPATLRSCAPELGQHTEQVLLETCGYTWDEIAGLKEREVI